jgi:hypothetical protein
MHQQECWLKNPCMMKQVERVKNFANSMKVDVATKEG